MDKDYIQRLIKNFFGNDVSPDIQQQFRSWLLSHNFQAEKEQVMNELWENESAEADPSTYQELARLNKRIRTTEKQTSFLRFYLRRIAAILLLPLIGAFGAYYYLTQIKSITEEPELKECFVPNGERKQIALPDGTKVWLNSGSLLVYSKELKGKSRILFLNGEASFEVAKDPDRPFLVKTSHMTVEALGTLFNLNAYSDQDVVIATLEEGKICVSPGMDKKTDLILLPDEQIIYNHRLSTLQHNKVDADRILKWTDGSLIFQSASFEQIVKTIERKFSVSINYETERFVGRNFTVKFNPDEGLEEVLEVMKEMIKGLKYKIKSDKVYIN